MSEILRIDHLLKNRNLGKLLFFWTRYRLRIYIILILKPELTA